MRERTMDSPQYSISRRKGVSVFFALLLFAYPCLAQESLKNASNGQTSSDVKDMCISQLADVIEFGTQEDHPAAERAFVLLQRAYLDALLSARDTPDEEVKIRVLDVLESTTANARFERVLAKFGKSDREKLLKFREKHTDIINGLFCDTLKRRVDAMKRIGKMKDPDGLAEPLITIALRHPSEELMISAVRATYGKQYRSDGLIDGLCTVLLHYSRYEANRYNHSVYYRGQNEEQKPHPFKETLEAIHQLKPPRAAPTLLKLIGKRMQNGWTGSVRYLHYAETLAATGEKRAIPKLRELLKSPGYASSMSFGENQTVSYSSKDSALLALVLMTGQSTAGYGFVHHKPNQDDRYSSGYEMFGFPDENARKDAIKLFNGWWSRNKDKDEYKNLKPLPISYPSEKAKTDSTTSTKPATTQPATTNPAVNTHKMPNEQTIRNAQDFIIQETKKLIKQFNSENFRKRNSAQKDLLALQQKIFRQIASHADGANAEARKRLQGVLTCIVSECRFYDYISALPAGKRSTAFDMRNKNSDFFLDYFSLSRKRREKAIRGLTKIKDPSGLLGPLLVDSVSHDNESIQMAAIKVAQKGKYRSDELSIALVDIILDGLGEGGGHGWHNYSPGNKQQKKSDEAQKAIFAIKNPAAVKILLAELLKEEHDYRRGSVLCEIIAGCGDKRAIPTLMKRLKHTGSSSSMSWSGGDDAGSITIAASDAALFALVKLTGQKEAGYNFVTYPYGRKQMGFKDAKARTTAIKKFNKWWEKNKSQKPYKNLKPLKLPSPRQKKR